MSDLAQPVNAGSLQASTEVVAQTTASAASPLLGTHGQVTVSYLAPGDRGEAAYTRADDEGGVHEYPATYNTEPEFELAWPDGRKVTVLHEETVRAYLNMEPG